MGTKEKKQNVLHIVKNLIAVGSNSKMELKSTVQNKGKIDCNNYGTKNVQKKKTKKKVCFFDLLIILHRLFIYIFFNIHKTCLYIFN